MQFKKPSLIFYGFLLITCALGCKKFVEIESPRTELVSATVFNDPVSATAALTNIYRNMYEDFNTFNIEHYTGLSGDELADFSGTSHLYKNTLNAVDDAGTVGASWIVAYNYIYQANAVLEGLSSSRINNAVKEQLNGEAKFIRGFWHFYLVNLYGDVPLVLSTNYNVNASLTRQSKQKVFQQIILDFKDAQNLLNTNFVDLSDTAVTTERVRPTKWAAMAMLAKTYLYTGDNINAELESTSLINNSALFKMENDLNNVFLMNSNETIWQLQASPTDFYVTEGNLFKIKSATSLGPTSGYALSSQLLAAFENNDSRKTKWVNSFTDPISGATFYYPFKYKADNTSMSTTEYSMVLRLAEQYLIRAEARTKLNNISGAQRDLNVVRNRAGLSNTTANNYTAMLSAIAHERQVELFTEWGNRWFDLKRTNKVDSVMSLVTPLKGGLWKSYQQLYPIPITDIQKDPMLTQTPGY